MTPFVKLPPSQRKVVKGFHLKALRTDMEIVEKLLKTHLGVEAKIEAPYASKIGAFYNGKSFSHLDIFIMTTKALNAKLVVETGTGSGISCGAFVTALKETGGVLYSVDKRPESENVKETMQRHTAQKDPVIFISGYSVEVGKKWDKGRMDILYCDSDHSYQYVLNELETWGRLKPKIIFIHDTFGTNPHGSINPPYRAAEDYAKKHGRLFVNIAIINGLGIII